MPIILSTMILDESDISSVALFHKKVGDPTSELQSIKVIHKHSDRVTPLVGEDARKVVQFYVGNEI